MRCPACNRAEVTEGHCPICGWEEALEAHERRITRCRTCHAKIIWFKTEAGKNMPVDADTVEPEDDELDLEKHTSHFASCEFADYHRSKR